MFLPADIRVHNGSLNMKAKMEHELNPFVYYKRQIIVFKCKGLFLIYSSRDSSLFRFLELVHRHFRGLWASMHQQDRGRLSISTARARRLTVPAIIATPGC